MGISSETILCSVLGTNRWWIMAKIASMGLSLQLVTPPATIERKIIDSVSKHLNERFQKLPNILTKQAQILIRKALISSPTTSSILGGKLREELGIEDASSDLLSIYNAIESTVRVNMTSVRRHGTGITGSIRLTAVPFDLESLLRGAGQYQTEKGVTIPWFQWLTTLGDRIIVRDFEIEGGHPSRSRTGDKIMIGGKRGWRIPPEFSGTRTNNFVTEATDSILPELGRTISKEVKSII